MITPDVEGLNVLTHQAKSAKVEVALSNLYWYEWLCYKPGFSKIQWSLEYSFSIPVTNFVGKKAP